MADNVISLNRKFVSEKQSPAWRFLIHSYFVAFTTYSQSGNCKMRVVVKSRRHLQTWSPHNRELYGRFPSVLTAHKVASDAQVNTGNCNSAVFKGRTTDTHTRTTSLRGCWQVCRWRQQWQSRHRPGWWRSQHPTRWAASPTLAGLFCTKITVCGRNQTGTVRTGHVYVSFLWLWCLSCRTAHPESPVFPSTSTTMILPCRSWPSARRADWTSAKYWSVPATKNWYLNVTGKDKLASSLFASDCLAYNGRNPILLRTCALVVWTFRFDTDIDVWLSVSHKPDNSSD